MVTGEPAPAGKAVGDKMTGGAVHGSGGFAMRATRVGSDTLLGQTVTTVRSVKP